MAGTFDHAAQEYDRIAGEYQKSKLLAFRRHVEMHSTLLLLPDLSKCSVVDLACGDGIYTRALAQRGAARTVGIDISASQIALARAAEAREPLGIEYLQADVAALEVVERFDVVCCAFLFNYARTRTELGALATTVARLARPGGTVVGCNDYPDNPPADYGRYRPYGFVKLGDGQGVEGSTITYRFFNTDGSVFDLHNYYLPTEAYQHAFAAAGLSGFEWVMPEVSSEGSKGFPPGFWDTYLQSPPIVSFRAYAT
jgi:SAM-dependent methyltransferase